MKNITSGTEKPAIRPGASTPINSAWIFLLLVALLATLFWRSFLPDYVHFSNDGPLGQQNSAYLTLPRGLTGMWCELNYLGANAGTGTLTVTTLLHILLSPVSYAKYYPPITLLLVGVGAWTFFRQLRLSPLAAVLGALAAVLNSTYFSTACWGVASQEIALAMAFFALALVVGCRREMLAPVCWARLALAGLCVGMNVMEAADIGALFSMLVALFVFFWALNDEGAPLQNAARGVGRVVMVTVFALFIAVQAVLALVGTQIQGVAGTSQDAETKAAQWDWATQWSLPKLETLGLAVPGLFGYKMDTPNGMMPILHGAYENGAYWGGVGRAPELDHYFDSGSKGPQPSNPSDYMRFTGGGNYCGILVLLVAGWALAQSFRRQDSVFSQRQKRMIWFLGVVMLACLLFAWGRFAPFYAILYHLPYFSTIRNPAKFIIFFGWALVMIFGYGVDGLSRRYLGPVKGVVPGPIQQFKEWWAKAGTFDRRWTFASIGIVVASVLGWLIYMAQKPALIAYLQKVGFPDVDPSHENAAPALLAFSYGQVEWFLVLLAVGVGLLVLVIGGCFSGPRAKIGMVLLGVFLVFDMGRANLPWVIHWDYKQKYEVGSLNPIVDLLRKKPYENRVAYGVPLPLATPPDFGLFQQLYSVEWMQHHFPFYNIQSLDIVQQPRAPEDMMRYEGAFQIQARPTPDGSYQIVPESLPLAARRWQLTSTRYLLGPAPLVDEFNQVLDPGLHRFHIVQHFDVQPKPGVTQATRLEELTAVPNDNGPYALFEFTGALPRAKVYSSWRVNTNDTAVLKTLGDLSFDPLKSVLVSTPGKGLPAAGTNDAAGSTEYQSYNSTHIVLSAKTTAPSVLLLNDKYDPYWSVTVDGHPADLLRCNFIMRGVYLPTSGNHTVIFDFAMPHRPLYVTVAAVIVGIGLGGFLFYTRRRSAAPV